MTAPRHCFRAHDYGVFLTRQVQQMRKGVAKFVGGHVVGVTAEGKVTPAEVYGIFFCVPEPAETFHVQVVDSLLATRSRKRIGIELRDAPRLGNAADIDEPLNAMRREQGQKFLDRSC